MNNIEEFLEEKEKKEKELNMLEKIKKRIDLVFEKRGEIALVLSLYNELRNTYLFPEFSSLLEKRGECSECEKRKIDIIVNYFTKNKEELDNVKNAVKELHSYYCQLEKVESNE